MNINELPLTRAEAKLRGFKHYFTGRPCSKGHLAKRHLTGTCVPCAHAATKRWADRNPGEGNRRSLEWQKKNPERCRLKNLLWRRKKDGVPEAPYPAPAACENCTRPFKSTFDTHLDHCHVTGKFRGWLCNKCNRGFGYFGDTLEGMKQGVRYLERAEERNK